MLFTIQHCQQDHKNKRKQLSTSDKKSILLRTLTSLKIKDINCYCKKPVLEVPRVYHIATFDALFTERCFQCKLYLLYV